MQNKGGYKDEHLQKHMVILALMGIPLYSHSSILFSSI